VASMAASVAAVHARANAAAPAPQGGAHDCPGGSPLCSGGTSGDGCSGGGASPATPILRVPELSAALADGLLCDSEDHAGARAAAAAARGKGAGKGCSVM